MNKYQYQVPHSMQAEVPLVFSAFKMSGYTPSQVSLCLTIVTPPPSPFHTYVHVDLSALGEAVFLELSGLE